MKVNLSAIAGGVVGAVLASVLTVLATTRVLPELDSDYTVSAFLLAFGVAAVGGVLGVVVGWLVHRMRAKGLGGIAAIVAFVSAVAGTVAWGRQAAGMDETGLYLVGLILLLGAGVIGLAAVCGLTAALLGPYSRAEDDTGWVSMRGR